MPNWLTANSDQSEGVYLKSRGTFWTQTHSTATARYGVHNVHWKCCASECVYVRSRQLPSVSLNSWPEYRPLSPLRTGCPQQAQRPVWIVSQSTRSLFVTGLRQKICILSVSVNKYRNFIQPFISIVKSLFPIKLKILLWTIKTTNDYLILILFQCSIMPQYLGNFNFLFYSIIIEQSLINLFPYKSLLIYSLALFSRLDDHHWKQ